MKLKKNSNFQIVKLDNKKLKNLNDVRNKILAKNRVIERESNTKPNRTKYSLNYIWKNISEDKNIEIPNILILRDEKKTQKSKAFVTQNYISCTANCEFSKRITRDANDKLLPKEERVNVDETTVLFVEKDNYIYAIIATANLYSLKRTMDLINYPTCSSVDEYEISTDFFHWLFYKYNKQERDLNKEFYLENIRGFTGVILSEEHSFSGKSDQTADLIITKAFITNGHPIKSLKLILETKESRLTFYINTESNIIIESGSEITLINQNMAQSDEKEALAIYVYFFIVPELLQVYKTLASDFDIKGKTDFLYNLGIEVIESIAKHNKIDLTKVIMKKE